MVEIDVEELQTQDLELRMTLHDSERAKEFAEPIKQHILQIVLVNGGDLRDAENIFIEEAPLSMARLYVVKTKRFCTDIPARYNNG